MQRHQVPSVRRSREDVGRELERTALKLFLQSGYDAVTVEQISGAAGISRRTFFRYFTNKSDLFVADARRRYDQVCAEMERRPRFEPTFTSLCESFVSGSTFDPDERELIELRMKLLDEQPGLVEKLRADSEPMGERLTVLVAARLGIDPVLDPRADLLVRLVRSAARSAQRTWFARECVPDLVGLLHQSFGGLVGAQVLDEIARLEREHAQAALG
jgi:AcrR family transcriptional regulator